MDPDLSVQLSELENRYAEALTADKDVKTLSRLWEKIKQLRIAIEASSANVEKNIQRNSDPQASANL